MPKFATSLKDHVVRKYNFIDLLNIEDVHKRYMHKVIRWAIWVLHMHIIQ